MVTQFLYGMTKLFLFHSPKPNLKALKSSLVTYAARWYRLGLELDIPDSVLDKIEVDSKKSCEEALTKMLQEWLDRCTNPTWGAVAQALNIIGNCK